MKSLREYIEELRSLDQNNIGSWPTWAYGFAIILVCAVIIAIGTWYFVLPKQETLERVSAREPELKQTFESKQRLVANIDAYRTQLEAMELQFGALLQQLPSKTEVPSLLNDISQTRIASGLEEELFKPRPENPQDFYAILPNDLIVTGTYHELGHFVSGVAALSRIVTIENINIEPIEQGDESGELRMSMTVNTYRYLEDAGDTTQPAGSKAQ
ncbi:Type 4 fimbrial biosis protein PilO [Salinisphaera shabanensis E1L3A]|uniref:Type 4 fimbrial biosis protein PilO n=1 Tax=Salinisphaera shabanensis E1L3A TaxID=1033802 RepID=U2E129_9GAMM|nr:type 4a pilus biogenesis protein PilO [Salinisphaera shabanensis]ERJ17626.1 Type 4 fimbrial biosis protein PilO [Salinisphaera shabanensis E1L3A]